MGCSTFPLCSQGNGGGGLDTSEWLAQGLSLTLQIQPYFHLSRCPLTYGELVQASRVREASKGESEDGGEETGFHPHLGAGTISRMVLNATSITLMITVMFQNVTGQKTCDCMDSFSHDKAKVKVSQLKRKNIPKNTESP